MKASVEMSGRVLAIELANGAAVLYKKEPSRPAIHFPIALRSREGQWYALKPDGGKHYICDWLVKYLYERKIARSDARWVPLETLEWYVRNL